MPRWSQEVFEKIEAMKEGIRELCAERNRRVYKVYEAGGGAVPENAELVTQVEETTRRIDGARRKLRGFILTQRLMNK